MKPLNAVQARITVDCSEGGILDAIEALADEDVTGPFVYIVKVNPQEEMRAHLEVVSKLKSWREPFLLYTDDSFARWEWSLTQIDVPTLLKKTFWSPGA